MPPCPLFPHHSCWACSWRTCASNHLAAALPISTVLQQKLPAALHRCPPQGMFLADLREQMDLYGLSAALTYLNEKTAESKGGLRQLASSPVFAQVRAGRAGGQGEQLAGLAGGRASHKVPIAADSGPRAGVLRTLSA